MKKKLLILLITVSMGLSACGVKSLTDAETSVEVEMEEETEAEAVEEKEETDADEMAEAEEIKEYVKGSLTETGWESEWLGIRYTCPEGTIMFSEEQTNEVMGLGQEVLSEDFTEGQINYANYYSVYEMMCNNEISKTKVFVLAEKLTMDMTASQYLEGLEKQMVAADDIPFEIVNSVEIVEIGGVDFAKLEVIVDFGIQVVHQDYYTTIKEDRAVSIYVQYADEAVKETIINGFSACEEVEEMTGYVKGSVTGEKWESEWLGIRFTCPEGMTMSTEEEVNEATRYEQELRSEYYTDEQIAENYNYEYEMMCIDEIRTTSVVVSVGDNILRITTEQFMDVFEYNMANASGYEIVNSGEMVEIGGVDFAKLEYIYEDVGVVWHENYYITAKGDKVFMITLTYLDETAVTANAMMNGFAVY